MKTLRPTTIIPANLYVEREADRQLATIVADMGRPAYVLEARQMGKTNLLLHLKRNVEKGGDFVAYFDLSVKAASARTFFRNIVDIITGGERPWQIDAQSKIQKIREREIVEAHREYDQSLRQILKSTDCRVVIVFDEIDSVVSSDYSDTIFSQIRSMYFSRVNYHEYERLTYVLSGVAEPTDLIKDKSISPFNIGDKVYLSDFGREESFTFFRKANLKCATDVMLEIFEQSAGNPRMTWDIASEVEDIELTGKTVTISHINAAVEKLYLLQFDRPPVDHIRALAESDPAIRSAISSIRWGAGATIDERVRAKLYLAGIVKYAVDGQVVIKNPIIDRALSDRWLTEVAERDQGLIQAAINEFRNGSWTDVIRLLLACRSQTDAPLPAQSQYQLALSYIYTFRYEDAERELRELRSEDLEHNLKMSIVYNHAIALHRVGKLPEAISAFRLVAEQTSPSRNVAINGLMAALLTDANEARAFEVLELGKQLLKEAVDDPDYAIIRTTSLFTMARAEEFGRNFEKAAALLDNALESAQRRFAPAIRLRRYLVTPEPARDATLLKQASEEIRLMDDRPPVGLSELEASDRHVGELASLFADRNDLDEAMKVLSYLRRGQTHRRGILRIALDILPQLGADFLRGMARLLDHVMVASGADAPPTERLEALRLIAQHGGSGRKSSALREYFSEANKIAALGDPISDSDGIFIFQQAVLQNGQGRRVRALEMLEMLFKTIPPSRIEQVFVLILAKQQEMMITDSIKDRARSRTAARAILDMIEKHGEVIDSQTEYSPLIRNAKVAAEGTLKRLPFPVIPQIQEIESIRSLGRNARITVRNSETGEVFNAKFKHVEDRLRAGLLVIVK